MAAISRPSSSSMRATLLLDGLVLVSMLFVMMNSPFIWFCEDSLRVLFSTKPLRDERGRFAGGSRGGHQCQSCKAFLRHRFQLTRSIMRRTSQRILDTELCLIPCDLGNGLGFDEDIHLLTDVDEEAIGLEAVDDLQDARVHAFSAAAGEGALWLARRRARSGQTRASCAERGCRALLRRLSRGTRRTRRLARPRPRAGAGAQDGREAAAVQL